MVIDDERRRRAVSSQYSDVTTPCDKRFDRCRPGYGDQPISLSAASRASFAQSKAAGSLSEHCCTRVTTSTLQKSLSQQHGDKNNQKSRNNFVNYVKRKIGRRIVYVYSMQLTIGRFVQTKG